MQSDFDRENVNFRFSSHDLVIPCDVTSILIFFFISGQALSHPNRICYEQLQFKKINLAIILSFIQLSLFIYFIYVKIILYNIVRKKFIDAIKCRSIIFALPYIFGNNHAFRRCQRKFEGIRQYLRYERMRNRTELCIPIYNLRDPITRVTINTVAVTARLRGRIWYLVLWAKIADARESIDRSGTMTIGIQ